MSDPCPRAGTGVHRWLLSEANRLRMKNVSPTAAAVILQDATRGCGRAVPVKEIMDAVRRAYHEPTVTPAPGVIYVKPAPKWPERDDAAIRRVVEEHNFGLADLWEASPFRLESNIAQTEMFIDALFPGNPLLCCGKTQYEFDTRPREAWRGELSEMQFVVPSPMTSEWGETRDGKRSKHTLSNTGPRHYLVIEQDQGTLDAQAAVILALRAVLVHQAKRDCLALVVYSGGKSLHSWFNVRTWTEKQIDWFFTGAMRWGADPATFTRSQFVRLPDGVRDDGRRQCTYYFNPQACL